MATSHGRHPPYCVEKARTMSYFRELLGIPSEAPNPSKQIGQGLEGGLHTPDV